MTTSYTTKFAVALLMAGATVKASISTDGIWTDNDHAQSGTNYDYKYTNGIPGSDDPTNHRRIMAPQALPENELSDWDTKANAVRVDGIVGEDNWNHWFSLADTGAGLTYENFLKAVAKFPYFCDEHNAEEVGLNTQDIEETCKRELATLFAHIAYESGSNDPWHQAVPDKYRQGLANARDPDCIEGGNSNCDQHEDSPKYAAKSGKQYFARGPLGIVGNSEYGAFGDAFGPVAYDSKDRFLEDPDEVFDDGYISFASALWFYMTPNGKSPSMHDVMTKFWMPNSVDSGTNIESGFGATISIINGASECGVGYDTEGSANRYVYFQNFLTDLGLYAGEGGQSCAMNWQKTFPYGGAQNSIPQYFVKGDWNKEGTCKAVQWESAYSIYVEDDYKRCVCDQWGFGADSCPVQYDHGEESSEEETQEEETQEEETQEEDTQEEETEEEETQEEETQEEETQEEETQEEETQEEETQEEETQEEETQEEETQEEETEEETQGEETEEETQEEETQEETEEESEGETIPLDLDNEVAEMFRQIWEEQHYNEAEGDLSRTLYQVDMSLDYIEDILIQFQQVMEGAGLYQN